MSRLKCMGLLIQALPLCAIGLLSGCASFSNDGGFAPVAKLAEERTGKTVQWARNEDEQHAIDKRVGELISKQLTVEDAVQVALLNNKGLQASFYELGISEADLVQAGRLSNPKFSMLQARNGGDYKIEQSFTFNVFSLFTMPLAHAVEQRRFAQTQQQVMQDVLRLAAETRKAYYLAIASQQTAAYMAQAKEATEAGVELAKRMVQAGNWSKLAEAREQAAFSDALIQGTRASQAAISAREQLTRLLGLSGHQTSYVLPERLPDLPSEVQSINDVEALAMNQRLDLQAVRLETEALAKNLGLSKATRFINVLEFGPTRVLEGQRTDPYKRGYEISFELPLFDWGGAKVAKAESIYMQAINRAAEAATNARSEVRESYSQYRSAYDLAKHYRDDVMPLRKRIAEEKLLRYNGMLISVFDLLADARLQITAANGYIEALRDFWLAQAQLDMALNGKPTATITRATATSAPINSSGH